MLIAGGSGGNTVNASAVGAGKTIYYYAGSGADAFTGGAANSAIYATVAEIAADTFTFGSGYNTLVLSNAGTVNLSGVTGTISSIYLGNGGANSLTIPNNAVGTTLVVYGGNAGNSINASGIAAGKTVYYYAGSGQDAFTGGAANNAIYVTLAELAGDKFTFGSGYNSLVLSNAGTVNLSGVTGNLSAIYLGNGGQNTLTVNNALVGSTLVVHAGTGGDTVDARTLSANKSLYYYGGNENDTLYLTAAGLNSDYLTLGGGTNSVVLTTAGAINLANVSGLNYLYLGNGGHNTLTLSASEVGSFMLIAGGSGGNTVNASAVGAGKTIYYYAGSGTDAFTGGAANSAIYATVAEVTADTFTFGSGYNTLVLSNAGTVNLSGVTGTISEIDLTAIDFSNLQPLTYTPANSANSKGTLTVTDGTNTDRIEFVGTYTLANFTAANDGNGGVNIVDPPVVEQQPGNAPAAIAADTVLEVNTPDSGNVTFAGSTGTLWLDQPGTFTGAVKGFGAQDAIDLPGIGFGANTTLGYSQNGNNTGGTLTVSDGAHTANIALLGQYAAASFATASDGHGGIMITDPAVVAQNQIAQPHA